MRNTDKAKTRCSVQTRQLVFRARDAAFRHRRTAWRFVQPTRTSCSTLLMVAGCRYTNAERTVARDKTLPRRLRGPRGLLLTTNRQFFLPSGPARLRSRCLRYLTREVVTADSIQILLRVLYIGCWSDVRFIDVRGGRRARSGLVRSMPKASFRKSPSTLRVGGGEFGFVRASFCDV